MDTSKTITAPAPHKTDKPLLPRILTGPGATLWFWVLPILLLLLLNLQGYALIEGNMNLEERSSARWLGFSNCLNLTIGSALYFVALARCRADKPLSAPWALPAIAIQILFLWQATANVHNILPNSVTLWIYPESRFFYHHYAFCMLPLTWGVIRVACCNAPFLPKNIGINILIAVLAPVSLFIVIQIASRLADWERYRSIGPTIVACIFVALSVAMFVALIRALMLLFKSLNNWGFKTQIILIPVISLCMPIGGLMLNRRIPFPVNFQAWEIYALVVINSVFLLWAALKIKTVPRFNFYLLCASFPFTLYFFIVFLPYTPLAILGCIVMGAGFLVLTPTVLFTLHLYQLVHAQRTAVARGNTRTALIGGLICFLLLPGFFTIRALMDKAALNGALDFVYSPDIESQSIEYPGNRLNLRRALSSHRNYKNGIYYPLLSDYYSWLVFDNLVLPDDKIAQLEHTFFGYAGSTENMDPLRLDSRNFWNIRNERHRRQMPRAAPPSRDVQLIGQDLRLRTADSNNTQATLTLTLKHMQSGGGEYINQFSIPPGVLINGFRLHINGTPVPGRIFEKKTALWVYTMIRDTERRDPGLLVYNTPEEMELRVFPIMEDTPAVVEIDFLIPDEVEAIEVPEALPNLTTLIPQLYPTRVQLAAGTDFIYITPPDNTGLSRVPREQTLHLIIDRSQENGFSGTRKQALQLARKAFPDLPATGITLANYNVVELNENSGIDSLPVGGGFDLDKALAHAIAQYTSTELNTAGGILPAEPIFVVIGRTEIQTLPELNKTRTWQSNLSALQVYSAGNSNHGFRQLTPDPGEPVPIIRVGDSLRPAHSDRPLIFPANTAAPEYYNPDSPQKWQLLQHDAHDSDDLWTQSIALWVQNHRRTASPGSATAKLRDIVAASRHSGVLLPATSYIVVENEAQWRMLERKEQQKLGQIEALDFLETPAPPGLVLLLCFGIWLCWRSVRAMQKKIKSVHYFTHSV